MGCLPLTLRTLALLLMTGLVLPVAQRVARETLSQARERYGAGRQNRGLAPTVAWLDPDVLSRLGSFGGTGRLVRCLVVARPMGP